MHTYLFYKRDENGRIFLLATAKVYPTMEVIWSGEQVENVKKFLASLTSPRFTGKANAGRFDIGDMYHWWQLPKVVSGIRLWVIQL